MLKTAFVGLPQVGKSTMFYLLTGVAATGFAAQGQKGMAKVPDDRLLFLAEMYKPRKLTPATIEFVDLPGLVRGSSEGAGVGNRFLAEVREADALVQVIRTFINPDVPHVEETIDPVRDVEIVELELLMADLEVIEKRIERIKTGKKNRKENEAELPVLQKCYDALSLGKPVSSVELADEERILLRGYTLLTEKPMLYVINVDEEQFHAGTFPGQEALQTYAVERHIPLLMISAKIEAEIADLPSEDQALFMTEIGLDETGISRLSKAVYETLGLISFLTAGEDEVRAWTIERNTVAKAAAGKIHSDIERGFIRAEVVSFKALQEKGSMLAAKEKGLVRLEGKEYVMQDGDIVNFRFNV